MRPGGPAEARNPVVDRALQRVAGERQGPEKIEQLAADGFEHGGFQFPEPSVVGFQAVMRLSDKAMKYASTFSEDGIGLNNVLNSEAVWVIWAMRHRRNEALLRYSISGEYDTGEAAEALNDVSVKQYRSYFESCMAYVGWIVSLFSDAPAAEEVPATGQP